MDQDLEKENICVWCGEPIFEHQGWNNDNNILLHIACDKETKDIFAKILKNGKKKYYPSFYEYAKKCKYNGCNTTDFCQCGYCNCYTMCHYKTDFQCRTCDEESCKLYKQ